MIDVGLIESITVWLCVAVAIATGISGVYIWYVYSRRKEDALFLTRLVYRDVRVSIASAVILGYLALALSGHSLGRPWGAILIGAAVVVMMLGVVDDALLWRKERQKR